MATKEKNPHLTRIGIFYDGNYFWHVSTFYYQFHERKSRLSVGGLHRFLKYQIAQLEGTSPELCKIVDAHYFRGRLSAAEAAKASGDVLFYERLFDDVLNSEGVMMHHLPSHARARARRRRRASMCSLLWRLTNVHCRISLTSSYSSPPMETIFPWYASSMPSVPV